MIPSLIFHSVYLHDHALLFSKTFLMSYLHVQIPNHHFHNKYLGSPSRGLRSVISTEHTKVSKKIQTLPSWNLKSRLPRLFQMPPPPESLSWVHFLFYILTALYSSYGFGPYHFLLCMAVVYVSHLSCPFTRIVSLHSFFNPNNISPNNLTYRWCPPKNYELHKKTERRRNVSL